jgi:hypothetical protein
MLEADLSEGDLSQVTQAIQNALKPASPSIRVLQALPKGSAGEEVGVPEIDDLEEDDLEVEEPARKTRSSRPRAVKPPKVVDGVDWDAEPSLKLFVEGFEIQTDFERYLATALWFREHRDMPTITPGHVYTAYRQLGWPTSIPDFVKPFRNMKDAQLFTGGAKEGFSINQLGEGKIKKKKRA